MTTTDHLIDLFAYDAWATDRILEALRAAYADRAGGDAVPSELEQAHALMSHAARAAAIWLGRVQGTDDAQLSVWDVDALAACAARAADANGRWVVHLQSQEPAGLEADVAYANSKGVRFTSTLRQIAAHVINHGTHHRSQIALLLRRLGYTPPPTDYIVYVRTFNAGD